MKNVVRAISVLFGFGIMMIDNTVSKNHNVVLMVESHLIQIMDQN